MNKLFQWIFVAKMSPRDCDLCCTEKNFELLLKCHFYNHILNLSGTMLKSLGQKTSRSSSDEYLYIIK